MHLLAMCKECTEVCEGEPLFTCLRSERCCQMKVEASVSVARTEFSPGSFARFHNQLPDPPCSVDFFLISGNVFHH